MFYFSSDLSVSVHWLFSWVFIVTIFIPHLTPTDVLYLCRLSHLITEFHESWNNAYFCVWVLVRSSIIFKSRYAFSLVFYLTKHLWICLLDSLTVVEMMVLDVFILLVVLCCGPHINWFYMWLVNSLLLKAQFSTLLGERK